MARTMANDPLQQYRFRVEVDGVELGCQNVDGLEKNHEVAEYREGGYNATHKLPGIPTTGEIAIEKGVFGDINLYNMFNESTTSENFRKTFTIIENDRLGNPKRQWVVTEAWVSTITAPSFDATSSEVSVESITVQYEDIEPETL